MERYFEHLINLVYREFYPKVTSFYGKSLPFASSYIKFGGFEISLHGYGRTSLAYEEVGSVKIIAKVVHFHTAHCFRADFDPTKVREHDEEHKLLKKKIAEY
ncbi:8795_t:CDS:2, partial [Ambispora gerdemannii]